MRHPPRHEVARVVVHEADHVDRLMAAQLELKDVALPELVRLGTFEATRRMFACVSAARHRRHKPGFAQDAMRGRIRDAKTLEPREHVADATSAPVRVGFLHRENLVDERSFLLQSLCSCDRRSRNPQPQRLDAAALEQTHKLLHDRRRHTKRDGDVVVLRSAHHRLDDANTNVERHRAVALHQLCFGRLMSPAFPFLRHLSLSSAFRVTAARTRGAMRISGHESTHCWRATHRPRNSSSAHASTSAPPCSTSHALHSSSSVSVEPRSSETPQPARAVRIPQRGSVRSRTFWRHGRLYDDPRGSCERRALGGRTADAARLVGFS